MNPLQRVLIEKQAMNMVLKMSSPAQMIRCCWDLRAIAPRLTLVCMTTHCCLLSHRVCGELARSFPNVERFNGKFVATGLDNLGKLLRRAAALAQSPIQPLSIMRNKLLAELPKNGTEIERMVRQRVG